MTTLERDDDKLLSLLEKLQRQTLQGRVDWTWDGDGDEDETPNSFRARLGLYEVVVKEEWMETIDGYGEGSTYRFILRDSSHEVDNVTDRDFHDPAVGGRAYLLLADIYRQARRSARGFGDAVDQVLAALEA